MIIGQILGDFTLQPFKLDTNKSVDISQLFWHSLTYTVVWVYIGLLFYFLNWFNFTPYKIFEFCLITFNTHFVFDYFISMIAFKYLNKGKTKPFTLVLTIDQILHIIQLVLTYILIFNH